MPLFNLLTDVVRFKHCRLGLFLCARRTPFVEECEIELVFVIGHIIAVGWRWNLTRRRVILAISISIFEVSFFRKMVRKVVISIHHSSPQTWLCSCQLAELVVSLRRDAPTVPLLGRAQNAGLLREKGIASIYQIFGQFGTCSPIFDPKRAIYRV